MVLGAFFVLLYTASLKYIGLAEVAILMVWGPLTMGGGYYILTGAWNWNVVLAGLPYALGATTIVFSKHIDKFDADRANGVRTLTVLLGERTARYTVLGLMALQYALVLGLVLAQFFTLVPLIVLFGLGVFRQVARLYRRPKPTAPPPAYPAGDWPLWFVTFADYHQRRFGGLFLLGLVGEVALCGIMSLIR
jgi:1,4-dihydroxy-2-naphthoate octaprenyltransferase